jgi:hypothetical protein
MLGSISPVGETSRNQRWWLTACAHTAASVMAGAAVGTVSGAVGQALALAVPVAVTVRLLALGAVLVAAAVLDAVARGRLPMWHRQVDERWLTTYRGWVYGAGFGAQLGVGVVTIVASAATYAMLVAAVLSASWHGGLLLGSTFGAIRSVPLLLMAPVRTTDRLYAVTCRVDGWESSMHRLTVAGEGVLAAAVLAAALATSAA